jgi:hypothetical protein
MISFADFSLCHAYMFSFSYIVFNYRPVYLLACRKVCAVFLLQQINITSIYKNRIYLILLRVFIRDLLRQNFYVTFG